MKTKIKYVLCTLLSVVITFSIVALPYFYYSVNDSKKTEATPEKLAINTDAGSTTSIKQLYDLIQSGNAIWINDNEDMSDFTLLQLVYGALQPLKESLKESDYAVSAIDLIMNDSEKKPALYENVIVSGAVDGVPVSARLMYVEFYGSVFNEAHLLFDRKTDKVYQFNIQGNGEIPNYDYDSDWDVLLPDIVNGLNEYCGLDVNNISSSLYITIQPDYFAFNVLGVDYYEMRNIKSAFGDVTTEE
ncbi:hypothetical protein [Ruminococcus sp.]|uniref:hypothetical protein n=1 Tax=Ruminococcus sp. TaxID=41978 RepID=UPI0025CE6CAE|nr:hypothetical protein [Ruminococcus sp.]MCI6617199.1 hypothetical protein [Ruminococcus sp.]